MKVRVFIYTGEEGEEYSGQDFEFEVMPQAGQSLRFTEQEVEDQTVEKVGFIQDGQSFIAAVWMKAKPEYGMQVVGLGGV
jgi:hypothetical protein